MPERKKRPSRATEPGPGERSERRLQPLLARAGYGSRRSVEELIRAGRVAVNGRVAILGDRAVPETDRITVDGVPVATHPKLRFFAFNKPSGVTATLRDPHASTSLAPYMPAGPRVFPVGRLDRESEGLLLLTNDGDLAHRLQHPRYGVEKEYLVEVEGTLSRRAVSELRAGVRLDDGIAQPLKVGDVQSSAGHSSIRLVMAEGRKRVVRRMLGEVGFPVKRLVRVRIGPVRLSDLRPGRVRPLLPDEVAALYSLTGLGRASPDQPGRRTRRQPRVEGHLD